MQKSRLACIAVWLVVCLCCGHAAPAAELYVAPAGKDSSPGSFEKPLATLEAARDAIRRMKAAGPLPPGGVAVWVRGGVYLRDHPFLVEKQDSGTAESAIVYGAWREEQVRLVGGRAISAPVIALKDASYVTIRGLTVEGGLGNCVQVDGGTYAEVAGCTIRNTGGTGIRMASGTSNRIQSCDLYDIGAEAISVDSGDRLTLVPGDNLILSNHIHHYGQVKKNVYAIELAGVGNRVAHNLIHDGPLGAVRYSGNDQALEYNEVHNIGLDGGGLGAFYSAADWASRGGAVQYNLVHHAPNANAVYLDDGRSGERVIGNIAYKVRCGPFIGGGHDNLIRGNIVIDCQYGIHVDDRGVARRYGIDGPGGDMRALAGIPYTKEPWASHYPGLVRMMAEPGKLALPTGNLIDGNMLLACGKNFDISGESEHFRYMRIEANVEAADASGLLVDPAGLNFHMLPEGLVMMATQFGRPIPIRVDRIGLLVDEYRRKLPTAEETGRFQNRPPR